MQPNKKQVIYTNNYGIPVAQNPNQMINENQRRTMKYAVPQKIIQNPQKVYLQNPNAYNYVQPTGNFRGTYNPSQLKSNPINNQRFEKELVEEQYYIDPKTGQRIILQSPKPIAHPYNNQVYNQQINKNPNTYKVENDINNNAYQDLTLTIDPFSLAKDQKKKKS